MKDKEIVTRIKMTPIYELNAVREYLESMAEKGLFFVGRKGLSYRFKKGTPQKLKYYVDVFDKGSFFDTQPEANTVDYIEFCQSNGWKYICTEGKLHFFVSFDENAVDIQTDEAQRLKSIHKMAKLNTIISPLIILLMAGIYTGSSLLTNNSSIFVMNRLEFGSIIIWLFAIVISLFSIFSYTAFYIRNKIRLKNGLPLHFNSYKFSSTLSTTFCIVTIGIMVLFGFFISKIIGICVLIGLFVGIITLIISSRALTKTTSRQENKVKFVLLIIGVSVLSMVVISIVVFAMLLVSDSNHSQTTVMLDDESITYRIDKIPYTLEDAGFTVPDKSFVDSVSDSEKLLTGVVYDYSATGYRDMDFMDEFAYIDYSVAKFSKSKYNEAYIESELSDEYVNSYENVDEVAKLWNASKAYKVDRRYEKVYLICYENITICISENLVDKTELYDVLTK